MEDGEAVLCASTVCAAQKEGRQGQALGTGASRFQSWLHHLLLILHLVINSADAQAFRPPVIGTIGLLEELRE